MIPQPTRFVHGQALRPETLNQILDTLRRQQPIAGPGIFIRTSPSGTIFSAKAQPPKGGSGGVFNHRWKVSVEGDETQGFKLHIAPGDLYLITDTGAVREPLIIPTNIAVDEERGGWLTEVSNGAPVAIYRNPDGKYTLQASTPTDGDTLIYVIASIVGPSSSHPTPIVTQLLYQDLYYWQGGAGAALTAQPWEVRNIGGDWMIYAPSLSCVRAAPISWDKGVQAVAPAILSWPGYEEWVSLSSLIGGEPSPGELVARINPNATKVDDVVTFATTGVGAQRSVHIGTFSRLADGSLSWHQENMGALVLAITHASAPYLAFEDNYGNLAYAPDFEIATFQATRIWIGRTHWMESLTMGGKLIGVWPYTDAYGKPALASQGLSYQLKHPVLVDEACAKLFTAGHLLTPYDYSGDETLLASKEERTSVVSVGVTSPSEETEQGEVYGHTRTTYSWVFKPSDNEFKTTLLYTEVEEANTTSTYTDASGLTE
jgi:hypothetical protein